MNYSISKPSKLLSQFVKHFWAMESCISYGEKHIQRIVPSGLSELIFYFDDIPKSINENITISENTVITGQLNSYYDIAIQNKISLFSIIFQPLGLTKLLDIPANKLFNQNVPLKHILKNTTIDLESQLYEAKTFAERINIAEQFIVQRLKKGKDKYHYNRIKHCIGLINTTKGHVSIDYLASEACLSRKQFERVFSEYIGTSPKRFMKTVRFQNVLHEKARNRNNNLTTLTYKCGYYDQSHMINDFLKLSGLTPKQYFSECEPFSDYFQ
uniref:AraC family transcriptional regulator n=1 Tax=uncultured Draconibacterium sp. TaxID=1573823 RepID=UPI0032175AD3